MSKYYFLETVLVKGTFMIQPEILIYVLLTLNI